MKPATLERAFLSWWAANSARLMSGPSQAAAREAFAVGIQSFTDEVKRRAARSIDAGQAPGAAYREAFHAVIKEMNER